MQLSRRRASHTTDRGHEPGGVGSSRRRSLRVRGRRSTLALLVFAGLLTPLLVGAVATGAEIPANFLVVEDQQGANDVNSDQVDLTLMGRDDSTAGFSKYVWNWDSTDSWTGSGQTGDACALYDTDGDGNINFAICVRVQNTNPTTVVKTADSPFVFSCSDTRSDRCSPADRSTAVHRQRHHGHEPRGVGSNLITDTDPFPTGETLR